MLKSANSKADKAGRSGVEVKRNARRHFSLRRRKGELKMSQRGRSRQDRATRGGAVSEHDCHWDEYPDERCEICIASFISERDSLQATLTQEREAWQRKEAGLRAILSRHREDRDRWKAMAERLANDSNAYKNITRDHSACSEEAIAIESSLEESLFAFDALKAGQSEKCKYSPPFINDHSQCQHQSDGGREEA